MTDRKDLFRYVRRARAHRGRVRAVGVALRTLFYALCGVLAALVASKCLGWEFAIRPWALGLVFTVTAAALVARYGPRPTLLETAAEVDVRAGLKERLSSALSLPGVVLPMEHALVEDARERLAEHPPSRLFPIRAPRELALTPVVAAAIAAVAYLVPPLDLLGSAARDRERKRDKEEISLAIEKLEHRKKQLEKDDRALDQVKEAIKKIETLTAEFHQQPPAERKEALARISKLSDELKQLKDELGRAAAQAEKLQKAAAEPGADAGELGNLMREGKFAQAVQALAKMRNALQEGKLGPAEREKLRRQMEALAQRLSKDRDLSEIEKKLARAAQGLQEGSEKDLDGLQQQLGQMDGELSEREQLAEALEDLERLSDALARGQGECPVCGKKHGSEGKDGKG